MRARNFAAWSPILLAAIVGIYAWIVYGPKPPERCLRGEHGGRPAGRRSLVCAADARAGTLGMAMYFRRHDPPLQGKRWPKPIGRHHDVPAGTGRLAACSAALLSAAVLPFAYRRRPLGGGFFLAIGAVQVVLLLVLTTFMEGSDIRRGLPGFYHLFIGLTLFAVAGGSDRLAWLRIVPVAAFAMLQTSLVWTAAGGHFLPDAGQAIYAKVGGYMLARPREDRNRGTFLEVQEWVLPHTTICCLSLAVHTFEQRVFCPEALNLLALENHQDTRFRYPWNFQDLSDGYRQVESAGYGLVLLDTRDAAPDVPQYKLQEPVSRLTADMIRRSREGSLAEVGWKEMGRFRREDAMLLVLEPCVRRPPGAPAAVVPIVTR